MLQEDAGLHSITDGEFRRRIWWSEFLLSLENVQGTYRGEEKFRDKSGHTVPSPRIDVTGKNRLEGKRQRRAVQVPELGDDADPKVTMPAPQQLYFFAKRETISMSAYPDLEQLWSDLADAYVAELKALAEPAALMCSWTRW